MLHDLQDLRLQHVGLEYVHICAFCGLEQLVALYMSFNKLKRPPELGRLKLTLEVLRLTENDISWIGSGYFSGFKKLRLVYLNHNRLQSVPCMTSLQTTLQHLKLDYNRLKSVDGIYNSGTFMSLQRLTLSGNNIASFNVSGFLNMPNLSYLSLMRNNLITLSDPRLFFKGSIRLSFNPWYCDPSISWMPSMATMSSKLVCYEPPCLLGNVIKHMSNNNNDSLHVAVNFPSISYRRPISHQFCNIFVIILHACRIIINCIISYL